MRRLSLCRAQAHVKHGVGTRTDQWTEPGLESDLSGSRGGNTCGQAVKEAGPRGGLYTLQPSWATCLRSSESSPWLTWGRAAEEGLGLHTDLPGAVPPASSGSGRKCLQ